MVETTSGSSNETRVVEVTKETSTKISITLKGEADYPVWVYAMESMFEQHGLMDTVNGHVSMVSGTDPETAAMLTKKKAKALSAIHKSRPVPASRGDEISGRSFWRLESTKRRVRRLNQPKYCYFTLRTEWN